ncbi:guanylate kinase [Fructilactobacillus ixorae]|uniref:Guanylate kinase n=1 Tax=Fructilactobacillus ixorae TaxID=1750535 RepID=A0ABY5C3Y0_9LACO|nr:guanylate kinase [Fructilactobacillus ixorae]USS93062.1 guanylate kinase [Fructilactobacillus ixorae]
MKRGQSSTERHIIVITGPAGAGKTTVQDYLETTYGIPPIITHTTRAPRAQEQDGVDYYFETPASFAALDLLEDVQYAGNRYGSSWDGVERAWQQHSIASIVLDTKGATTYQQRLGDQAVVIYLAVPDPQQLRSRMLKRGDTPAAVQARLHSAETQRDLALPRALQQTGIYVPNQDWEQTTQQLAQIIEKLSND